MNEPLAIARLIDDRYEIYRVVTDMDALHEGFRDRVEDLQVTQLSLDQAGGLQNGYAGKLLCNPPIKSFGKESLPRMLKATGMALVLVIDDERFAEIKEQLSRRTRPMRSIVRIKRPKWLFSSEKASRASRKRWQAIPVAKRKKMMRKVANVRWIAQRRRERLEAQVKSEALF
jgi:hypothetical protein